MFESCGMISACGRRSFKLAEANLDGEHLRVAFARQVGITPRVPQPFRALGRSAISRNGFLSQTLPVKSDGALMEARRVGSSFFCDRLYHGG
jgi:hypothetical protein